MVRLSRVALGLTLLTLPSCGSPSGAAAPTGAGALDVPRAGHLDKPAFAATLDHPAAPPVLPALPAPLRDELTKKLASLEGDRARLDAAKERMTQLTSAANPTLEQLLTATHEGRGALVVDLGVLTLLEPIARGDDPLRDEAAPIAFDAYVEAAALAAMLASSPRSGWALARWTADADAFTSSLVTTAHDAGDHVAASVLRNPKVGDAAVRVLRRLALRDLNQGQRDESLLLFEEVARSSATVDADTWSNLAYAYARAFDAPRAAVAAERARAAGLSAASSTRAQQWVTDARIATGRPGSTDVDARLAVANAYADLDLSQLAEEDYQALRRQFPKDARARLGLARARLEAFRTNGELRVLQSAVAELDDDGLEHVTAEFRELALGLTVFEASQLLAAQSHEDVMVMLSGLIDKLAARARAVRDEEPARARAFEYLAGLLRDVVQGAAPLLPRLARSFDETRAMRTQYPDSLDVAKIALAAAPLTDRRDDALADVVAPVHGAAATDASYLLDRATTAVALASYSADGASFAKVRAAIGDARAPADARENAGKLDALEGDLEVLDALHGSDGGWSRAQQMYTRALDGVNGADRARVLSNAGYVALRQARADDARAFWKRAADEDKAGQRARCNAAVVLASDAATRAEARAELESWVNDPESPCVLITLATLAAIGKANGEPRARLRDLAEAWVGRFTEEGVFVGPPDAVEPQMEFRMGAGLRSAADPGGWPISLDLGMRVGLWFHPRAPLDAAAMRKLAGK